MQVFMPFNHVSNSLLTLDKSRLGNQIWREAKTLLNGGWSDHPVSKMWFPYKPALAAYCLAGLKILRDKNWIKPDKVPGLEKYFFDFLYSTEVVECPYFMGNEDYHKSHRLNLLYKGQQDQTWADMSFVPRGFPVKRSLWLEVHWQAFWKDYGRPDPSENHYKQFFDEEVPESKPEYVWPTPPDLLSPLLGN